MIKAAMCYPIIICLFIIASCWSAKTSVAGERSAVIGVSASKPLVGERHIPNLFINIGQKDRDYALLVDKSVQRLNLYAAGERPKLIKVYPASTGRKFGDKKRLGDLRTPEGVYFFTAMYDKSQLHPRYGLRAFVMDYPNFLDYREGKNGGGIWLHATNLSKRDLNGYDTRGCIVVSNQNILELSSYITLKDTPIIVVDKIRYSPISVAQQYEREVMAMLRKWESDWENKHLDGYMSHYSSHFFARGMNKDRWRDYKEGLNQRYAYINVKIENQKIFRHDGIVVVSFRQHYHSDKYADVGLKKLFLTRENRGWKIITEQWTALTPEELKAQRLSFKGRARR